MTWCYLPGGPEDTQGPVAGAVSLAGATHCRLPLPCFCQVPVSHAGTHPRAAGISIPSTGACKEMTHPLID